MNLNKSIALCFLGLMSLSACGSNSAVTEEEIDVPATPTVVAGNVTTYTTTTTGTYSLTKGAINLQQLQANGHTIKLNPQQTYQTMDGFGAAITYSSAYNLLKMEKVDRDKFLRETFSDTEGFGYSYVRISIGCSDFSSTEYTCCDQEGLEHFSLHSDDTDFVIPVMKEILAINPKVKVIGSPWTCPKWMKVDNLINRKPYDKWNDGHLDPNYYQAYADYFVKWIRAYEAAGVPIYAVTPQNEPLNHGNSASTYMPWEEETAFLQKLAPTFKQQGVKAKIYVFDHNYNYDGIESQTDYPIHVYNSLGKVEGAELIVGAAYHNYGGNVSELDDIHAQAPSKGLIFSETSIGTWNNGRNLKARLMDDMEQVALGTVNRYCTAVMVWNLMLDTNRGPNRDGGCQTCYGAVDISAYDYKTITRNSHYYIIAHLSSVVKPDARRIGISEGSYTAEGLTYAAFQNTDGSYAIVLCNRANTQRTVTIAEGSRQFDVVVPSNGVVSCIVKE